MFFQVMSLIVVVGGTLANIPSSRSVTRSGPSGTFNLVEFNVRGVNYGQCSFRMNGEDITAMYEERGDELIARTTNPTIVDPISKARMCRQLASQTPEQLLPRNDFGESQISEPDWQLNGRLFEFERKIAENQNYARYLKPRFLKLLKVVLDGEQNKLSDYGFTHGVGTDSIFGINYDKPTKPTSTFNHPFFGK